MNQRERSDIPWIVGAFVLFGCVAFGSMVYRLIS
jgi:hypothetical protein